MEQNQPQKAKRDWLKIVFQAAAGLIAAIMLLMLLTFIFASSHRSSSNADAERWEGIVQQKMRELEGAAN